MNVFRLQGRMWDLQKPLSRVNAALWQEIRLLSEKEVLKQSLRLLYLMQLEAGWSSDLLLFPSAAQSVRCSAEGQVQPLQKTEQSSVAPHEGGSVHQPHERSSGTSTLCDITRPAAPVLLCNLNAVLSQEEQQTLRGRLEQADQMIRSLDGCIAELEAGEDPDGEETEPERAEQTQGRFSLSSRTR